MSFIDEKLALAKKPDSERFDPNLKPTSSVAERIPDLANRNLEVFKIVDYDAFMAFLEAFSIFLQNPLDNFYASVERIEQEMLVLATQRAKALDNDYLGGLTFYEWVLIEIRRDKPDRTAEAHKIVDYLLSTTLTQIENRFMFPGGTDRARATTLTGLVPPEDFRSDLLSKNRTWKDANVEWTHGEFTHRIQWCAAMLHFDTKFDWSKFFMAMGAIADENTFGDGKKAPTFGLWDALVDRNRFQGVYNTPYLTSNAFDFRSPENFQGWLLGAANWGIVSGVDSWIGKPKISILAAFVKRRAEWRKVTVRGQYKYLNVPYDLSIDTIDHWTRVLFNNKSLAQLVSDNEKRTLANAIYRLAKLRKENQPAFPILVLDDEGEKPPVDMDEDDQEDYDKILKKIGLKE